MGHTETLHGRRYPRARMADLPTTTGGASPALLADLTSLRVGGPASTLVSAGGPDDIAAALDRVATTDPAGPGRPADPAALLVLGGGTNVIVSDDGFAGTVLRVTGGASSWHARSDGTVEVAVDAGVEWDDLVAASVARGLTGIELMSGIPGSVGASPIQNIGAYGQQVADVISRVEVIDRRDRAASSIDAEEIGFGFRHSNFKDAWRDRFVVTRVHLRLHSTDVAPPRPSTYVDIERHFAHSGASPTDVAARRRAVLDTRRAKSMLLDPRDADARSVGSFFINPTVPTDLAVALAARFETLGLAVHYLEGHGAVPPERTRIPAAHVLRAAGFHPGDRWGPVATSTKHVLALVTRPGATANDVWQVANAIRARAAAETGVELAFEATFLGEFPPFDAAAFEQTYPYEPAPDVEPAWLSSYRDG